MRCTPLRHVSQSWRRSISANASTILGKERRMGIQLQQHRNIIFRMMNKRPAKVTGFFVTFPDLPNETVENNAMLANIARNEDWPALTSASPKEFYEGTVRLLMEHGATVMEHLELLAKEKDLPKTYESVLDPLMTELYDVEYAYHTLLVKMLTDWPDCKQADFDMDLHHIGMLYAFEHMEKLPDENFQKALEAVYYANNESDPWRTRLVTWLLSEIRAHGVDKHAKKFKEVLQSWQRYQKEYNSKFWINILSSKELETFDIEQRGMLPDAPHHVLKMLSVNKIDPEKGPWKGKMTPDSIYTLLRYCDNRHIRQTAWHLWISRAAFNDELLNNSVNIEEIRHNNEGVAKLLGYKSISEYALSHKMAGTPETVRNFITSLSRRMRPAFNDRLASWDKYAAAREMITAGVEPFDLFYICRREAEAHYNVDALELRKYFPFWPTFDNLCQVLGHFFGLKFVVGLYLPWRSLQNVTSTGLERCHPSVKIFSVADRSTGEHLGRLYVDPFERRGKTGKWNTILGRPANTIRSLDKIVFLIGSADAPGSLADDSSSLLHHTQLVELLFHMGRSVQLLLSRSPYRELTKPTFPYLALDWDAADYFPQFVQFFACKPNILSVLSCPHVETGEILNVQSVHATTSALARSMLWESYRTLFWTDFDASMAELEDRKSEFWHEIYKRLYKEYFPFRMDREDFQPCSFIPTFGSPSYLGLYYRKLWSEMLALDIHETFEREGRAKETGERLKTTILNNGALETQGELFRRFQGRDPSVSAICDFYDPPLEIAAGEQVSGHIEGR